MIKMHDTKGPLFRNGETKMAKECRSECVEATKTGGGTRRGAANVENSGAVVAAPATC